MDVSKGHILSWFSETSQTGHPKSHNKCVEHKTRRQRCFFTLRELWAIFCTLGCQSLLERGTSKTTGCCPSRFATKHNLALIYQRAFDLANIIPQLLWLVLMHVNLPFTIDRWTILPLIQSESWWWFTSFRHELARQTVSVTGQNQSRVFLWSCALDFALRSVLLSSFGTNNVFHR